MIGGGIIYDKPVDMFQLGRDNKANKNTLSKELLYYNQSSNLEIVERDNNIIALYEKRIC